MSTESQLRIFFFGWFTPYPEFNQIMVRFDQTTSVFVLIHRSWRIVNSHDKTQFNHLIEMNSATTSKILDWQSKRIEKGLTGPKSIQELPWLDVLSIWSFEKRRNIYHIMGLSDFVHVICSIQKIFHTNT